MKMNEPAYPTDTPLFAVQPHIPTDSATAADEQVLIHDTSADERSDETSDALIPAETHAVADPQMEPSAEDLAFLRSREEVIDRAMPVMLSAARALYEIFHHRDGVLWRSYGSFDNYCKARWQYSRSHAYRQLKIGGLIVRLEMSGKSPNGDKVHFTESHFRPLIKKVPEHLQVECWEEVSESVSESELLTARKVDKSVDAFLAKNGIAPKVSKKGGKAEVALNALRKLEAEFAKLEIKERSLPLLKELERLLEECGGGVDVGNHLEQADDNVIDAAVPDDSGTGELPLCCEPPSPSSIEARPAAGVNWFRKPDGEAVIGYVQESDTPPHLTILNPDDGSEIPLPADYVWIGTTAPSTGSATLVEVEVMSAPQI